MFVLNNTQLHWSKKKKSMAMAVTGKSDKQYDSMTNTVNERF